MRKVVCINNQGLEVEFIVGNQYDVDREFDTTYIVTNRLGKKHTVFKTHFKPAEDIEGTI
jgi:hypothetical protein